MSLFVSSALPAQAQNAEQVLAPVAVRATVDDGSSGYVAKRARTATKSDTPLIETPQSISVITREQLDMRNVQTVTEALRYTAGITTQPYGADPRYDWLFIRGFSSTTLGNYRDGLRQITPACCFSVYRLDGYEMEQVEVLKGPSSVLYGQNSPGGIVNRVSKKPTANPLNEVKVDVGNFERRQGAFDVGGAQGDVLYRVVGVYRDSDTQFRDAWDDRRSISPSLTWRIGERTQLTVLTNYLEDFNGSGFTFTYPGTATTAPRGSHVGLGEVDYNGFDHRQSSYGYEFTHAFNDSLAFAQKLRRSDIAVDYRTMGMASLLSDGHTVQRNATRVREDQNELALDNQFTLNFATAGIAHRLLLGIDYLDVDLDSQTQRNNAGAPFDVWAPVYGAVTWPTTTVTRTHQQQDQTGVYLQDQMQLDPHWILTLGARQDRANTYARNALTGVVNDQHDSEFSGRAGLTWLIGNGWAPYLSYSESFLPNIGFTLDGNAFEPTTGKQYELGVKFQPDNSRLLATVALFDLYQQNVLTTDPRDVRYSVQTGEVRSRGVELEAQMSFDSGIDLIAAYTYTDIANTKTNIAAQKDQRTILIPEQTASFWANYMRRSGALQGAGAGLGVRYTGKSAIDPANQFENPSTTLVDATALYERGAWRYSVNANNVFDKEFANCSGSASCVWGAERSVIGSARYRW